MTELVLVTVLVGGWAVSLPAEWRQCSVINMAEALAIHVGARNDHVRVVAYHEPGSFSILCGTE